MKIKNTKVYGMADSIIRSGYPMQIGEPKELSKDGCLYTENDYNRANKLANTPNGSGHNNFLKGIIVQFDLQYPQYFTPQLQRYNFIDIVSSQSKMHRLTSLDSIRNYCTEDTDQLSIDIVDGMIAAYKKTDDTEVKKILFNRIISSLPMGYLMWMGISTNYLQLKTIYAQRCKHKHKLKEWQEFGGFIESLPMSELITGKHDRD